MGWVIYKEVSIRIQGIVLTADLYALHLGVLDVVLGVKWLGLGKMMTDYGAGTVEFN